MREVFPSEQENKGEGTLYIGSKFPSLFLCPSLFLPQNCQIP